MLSFLFQHSQLTYVFITLCGLFKSSDFGDTTDTTASMCQVQAAVEKRKRKENNSRFRSELSTVY